MPVGDGSLERLRDPGPDDTLGAGLPLRADGSNSSFYKKGMREDMVTAKNHPLPTMGSSHRDRTGAGGKAWEKHGRHGAALERLNGQHNRETAEEYTKLTKAEREKHQGRGPGSWREAAGGRRCTKRSPGGRP
jgi:hypothetical protein